MNESMIILSLLIFLPAMGALVVAFFPKGQDDAVKMVTLAFTLMVLGLAGWMAVGSDGSDGSSAQFDTAATGMQGVFSIPWISSFQINYMLGFDGISFPLVVLTAFLSVLAFLAAWSITKHVKGFCILFLLLETGMMGAFLSLDFFLFYVFWELMLLPMYFLIGIWGGPRREYAALKFFLYTFVGSVGMLIAMMLLYFNSDLTDKNLTAADLDKAHVLDSYKRQLTDDGDTSIIDNKVLVTKAHTALLKDIKDSNRSAHTFNIPALQLMGQKTDLFDASYLIEGWSIQHWVFLLLLVGFLIKVPAVPFHTWLPDAHVEAPTPISMLLAGVMLKLGGYGILRFCYPICPDAGADFAMLVCSIGVLSMVYGAFAALAQKDFKRLVAYSSVSHMGYVVLGIGIWSVGATTTDYWEMGVNAAMFQMIGHGISSAGMFFMVGVLYERVHHRNLDEFGGLFVKMPGYCAMAWIIFLAGVGLPGLCGFIGEAFVVLASWNFSVVLGCISAFTVILTGAYILWVIQRVYMGPEYKGPHEEALTPMNAREWSIAIPLVVCAFIFGVFPNQTVFRYTNPTIKTEIEKLTESQSDRPTTSEIKQTVKNSAKQKRPDESVKNLQKRPVSNLNGLVELPPKKTDLKN